ncbi:hypothetical protein C3L33_14423, partial [Rhododendron williamsianum]
MKVDYPVELDVYDLCSDDLRKKLKAPRKGSSNVSGESSNATSKEGVVPDKEMHLTGIYNLVAVLTHKGRSADSGHYVAWVKQESGIWIQYDNPIPQWEEDITKLSREVIGIWLTFACTRRLFLFQCNVFGKREIPPAFCEFSKREVEAVTFQKVTLKLKKVIGRKVTEELAGAAHDREKELLHEIYN